MVREELLLNLMVAIVKRLPRPLTGLILPMVNQVIKVGTRFIGIQHLVLVQIELVLILLKVLNKINMIKLKIYSSNIKLQE